MSKFKNRYQNLYDKKGTKKEYKRSVKNENIGNKKTGTKRAKK